MEDVVVSWWKELKDNKGASAELRRALTPNQVYFHPAYYRLLSRLSGKNEEKLALVAGLCSHVKENSGSTLGTMLASGGDRPLLSEARFKRLLAISERDSEKLYRELVRVVRMAKHSIPLDDLVKKAYYWNDRTKRDLAHDYYGGIAASALDSEADDNQESI